MHTHSHTQGEICQTISILSLSNKKTIESLESFKKQAFITMYDNIDRPVSLLLPALLWRFNSLLLPPNLWLFLLLISISPHHSHTNHLMDCISGLRLGRACTQN